MKIDLSVKTFCWLVFTILFISLSPVVQSQQVEGEEQTAFQQETDVPRTILALYKGREASSGLVDHPLHLFMEMPLNHLGLKVRYWDIEKGLPDLAKFPPLRGILSWFYDEKMENPEAYLKWAATQVKAGTRFLVIENIGAYRNLKKKRVEQIYINNFLNQLGLQHQDNWVSLDPTASLKFHDERYVYFEQNWIDNPAGIDQFALVDSKVVPFIAVEMLEQKLPVATIGPNGGMVFESYFIKVDPETYKARWIVNPFYFLGEIFGATHIPKPDVTTMNGRRLYFSHIDGDGWRSGCQITGLADKICSEVIMEKAIIPYPDLPVTVAPIAADLDPTWYGSQKMQDVARRIFELPQVQGASHTYSHPFAWGYYDNSDPAKREAKDFTPQGVRLTEEIPDLNKVYARPRAYLKKPYNTKLEVVDSLTYIQQFMPFYKKVRLLQWSGNCKPYEQAMELLVRRKFLNINGGDSRFDKKYPSYSSVCAIGRNVGGYRQIYAVNSNENTYTDGWTQQFHAFKYVKKTFKKTEMPLRVKGMNIYYHMYSGEKEAALAALLSNLDYVRTQEIIPVDADYYAEIGEGFYQARFVRQDEKSWRVLGRGALQTVRFDKASDKWIDLSQSEGVLGARHHQGSLYIALDPADSSPLIVLKESEEYYQHVHSQVPYLIESRWKISGLKKENGLITFQAQGYGPAEMCWGVSSPGKYRVVTKSDKNTTLKEINVGLNHILKFKLDIKGFRPVQFEIMRLT